MMDAFNQERARRGAMQVRIGVGIASGPLVAGFTGTQRRMTYTGVGDVVNLAAHLEAHTKVVGQPILIDENTRGGLGESSAPASRGRLSCLRVPPAPRTP